jgi:polygalacturonase
METHSCFSRRARWKNAWWLGGWFFLSAILAQAQNSAGNLSLNVADYGAVGDGRTLNTEAIQKAIDDCSAKGGGMVDFPAGHFLSGTIQIKDGVTLRLAADAVLLGSTKLADYQLIDGFTEGLGVQVGYAFVIAVDAKRIGIEGPGEIDGQGKALAAAQAQAGDKHWGKRPFLIRLVRCEGVVLKNLKIAGSGAWTTHLSRCKDILIAGVAIESFGLPHNDGIDIDSCQKMQIRDCNIHSGDDAICFKTLSPDPCQDIVVSHCKLQTNEGAIKFGTESAGAFANISVSDCEVIRAREGGIKLFSVDGSHMQNISVSDIKMANVNLPIIVRLGARLHTFHPGDQKQEIGSIEDVQIKNIEAKSCTRIGILISGIPGHPVENLSMQNIKIELPGGGRKEEAQTVLPENEGAYPEVKMFGNTMPAYGAYIRHVKGLKIDGLVINLSAADQRPGVFCQDAENVEFAGWRLPANPGADAVLYFDTIKHGVIREFRMDGSAPTFLSLKGTDSTDVRLIDNQWGETARPFELGAGVSPAVLNGP